MGRKLEEIEWLRFPDPHGGVEWRVVLSTPRITELLHDAMGRCFFDEYTITIDAGYTPDEIGETLQHELFHVARGRRASLECHNNDHKFFSKTSPVVWSINKILGVCPLPRLPRGWRALQRSSRAWKAAREWSE